jgi:hypothetical protein
MQDFLNCVRTRQPTKSDAYIAHRTCALIHLGEAAYRTKTVVDFDPKGERVLNSDEASALLTKDYREPYGLPEPI